MQFSSLIQGTLIKRYKRFLADVELADGTCVTAHCPNTGAMTGCAEPGYRVWLSHSDNPKRKLAYTWELAITNDNHWIGINTHNANKLVKEALQAQFIPALGNYTEVKPEVRFGQENSRIDFLLSAADLPDAYVEVKSVTLLQGQQGYFPDARTARGVRHLRELAHVARQGHRAVLLFCVQHTGINQVTAAGHIDAEYADTLKQVVAEGVEVIACGCQISEQNMAINQILPFNL